MTQAAADEDRAHLRRALELAGSDRGAVSPNPLVGALIVAEGVVLGEGFHAELGGIHAEVAALADCRERRHDPAGATMYVTLEPCAHHGRQPPCTEAILAAGIARVVVGSDDPSAKAAGRGPAILREAGVEVELADGDEATVARLLNQPFRKRARSGRPLVVFKAAVSLDGFTATSAGDSKWISSAGSRALVHVWRHEADAVAIGIATALADDPLLTARDPGVPDPRQPARVVFDSAARLPLDTQLVRTIGEAPLYVVVDPEAPASRAAALREAGVELLEVAGSRVERVGAALDQLGQRGLESILLEGGAELAGSFREAGEIDELRLFIAPVVLGGGRPLFAGRGPDLVADAQRAEALEWERSGDDILLLARLREW